MDWTWRDFLTFGPLIVGAVIMAMEAGLKGAPRLSARLPSWITSEKWFFAPLGLMISTGVLCLLRFGIGISFLNDMPDRSAIAPTTARLQYPHFTDNQKWQIARELRTAEAVAGKDC